MLTQFKVKHPSLDTSFRETYIIGADTVDLGLLKGSKRPAKKRPTKSMLVSEATELATTVRGMKAEHTLHQNGRHPNLIEIIKIARSRRALPNIYDK